jgi:UDP-glucose 4-epimerase
VTSQTWLITGGAGYIGAHIADLFLSSGKEVVIYDLIENSQGTRIQYLRKKYGRDIPFVTGDIRDSKALEALLIEFRPFGVIHAAALKSVAESMEKPDEYHDVNFEATSNLLDLITRYEIRNFVFSSTAAVYGSPDHLDPIKESEVKQPISPYGKTKLAAEEQVNKYLAIPGNHGTSLRFFNVVGTSARELMDDSVANLVPIVIKKLKSGESPIIYGTNYQTKDGTCVRDYIDVRDVAEAHLACANPSISLPNSMNVGTGSGASVREVIGIVCEEFGIIDLPVVAQDRRIGDPAFLCADVSLIQKTLKFRSKYSLRQSIQSLFEE